MAGRMISGLDHTLIGVRDLELARMSWTRLGFATSPRGRHIGWGTANYCLMFERDYIELLGIVDPAQFTNNLDRFLARREGLMGVAFASPAVEETARALAARGLHPSAPKDLARQLELPEGTALPRFKLVFLPPEETPGLTTFVVEHLTPELLRRPEWLAHPNGALGLAGVTTIVADTAPLVEKWGRLLGASRVVTTDDIVTAHVGDQALVFCTAEDFGALYPEVELPPALEPPAPALMSLHVQVLGDTADCLASWHIDHEGPVGGRIVVPADEANGTILEFIERR
jgi:Glyoxalase-like domain